MKRLFNMLLLSCVNVPALAEEKCLTPYISFLSHHFAHCQFQRPFILSPDLHSSSFYLLLPPALILWAVKA